MFGELFQCKVKQSWRESCEDLNVCLWLLSFPQLLRGSNSTILAPGWGRGPAAWKDDLRSPNWLNQGWCPQPHGEETSPSCQPCSVHCLQRDLPYSGKLQPHLHTRRRELTSSNHTLTTSRNLRDLSLPSMRSPICHPLHSWPLGEEWFPLIPTTCKGAKGIPKGGDSGRSGYIQTNIRVAWDYQNRLTNHIMWFTLKQS